MRTVHDLGYAAGQRAGTRNPAMNPAGVWELAKKRARLALARRTFTSERERTDACLLYARVFAMQVLEVLLDRAEGAGDTVRVALLWRYYDALEL